MEKQTEVFGVRAAETPPLEIGPVAASVPEVIIPPVTPIPAVVTQLLMFDISSEALQRRKATHKSPAACAPSDQLGLFGN